MEDYRMENNVVERIENIGLEVTLPTTATDVLPLNCETAFSCYTEAEQREIMELANSIDVTERAKVLNYGSVALKKTFEQCGEFLKSQRGTQADMKVISQVIELSKKASESREEFNLVLKEPNFLQKLCLKVLSSDKSSRMQKIENCAKTSYNLLIELKKHCDIWVEMLEDSNEEIEYAALSDYETVGVIEKFIIAGKIAQKRTENELKEIESKYQESGMQQYASQYDKVKEGYEAFRGKIIDLETSRVAYYLSIGQLALIKRGNMSVQESVQKKVYNSLTLFGQQLRNSILNEKTREVLEGQKAITKLSNELIKEVSIAVGFTAKEAEEAKNAGFLDMKYAKEAVETVLNACNEVKKMTNEVLPTMEADLTEINNLIKQLEPRIESISIETLKTETPAPTGGGTTGGLKF